MVGMYKRSFVFSYILSVVVSSVTRTNTSVVFYVVVVVEALVQPAIFTINNRKIIMKFVSFPISFEYIKLFLLSR